MGAQSVRRKLYGRSVEAHAKLWRSKYGAQSMGCKVLGANYMGAECEGAKCGAQSVELKLWDAKYGEGGGTQSIGAKSAR